MSLAQLAVPTLEGPCDFHLCALIILISYAFTFILFVSHFLSKRKSSTNKKANVAPKIKENENKIKIK